MSKLTHEHSLFCALIHMLERGVKVKNCNVLERTLDPVSRVTLYINAAGSMNRLPRSFCEVLYSCKALTGTNETLFANLLLTTYTKQMLTSGGDFKLS